MKSFPLIGVYAAIVFLSTAPVAAAATGVLPGVYAAQACPQGTIWDEGKKECVPFPRGSFDGN